MTNSLVHGLKVDPRLMEVINQRQKLAPQKIRGGRQDEKYAGDIRKMSKRKVKNHDTMLFAQQ